MNKDIPEERITLRVLENYSKMQKELCRLRKKTREQGYKLNELNNHIRVTIDSKCKDSDDDIIEALMNGADKYFYPYCCSNEHIEHTNSTAHKVK